MLCNLSPAFPSHRTLVPIKYPPHTVALGGIYVAALLSSFEHPPQIEPPEFNNSHEIAQMLNQKGDWEERFQTYVEDLEGALNYYSFQIHPC